MKIKIVLYISFFALGCSNSVYKGAWPQNKIVADGNESEWNTKSQYIDVPTNISLKIANDDQFMYFAITIPEQIHQMKAMESGIELWLDTTGRNKQLQGIIYPISKKENFQPMQFTPDQNFDFRQMQRQRLEQFNEIELRGFYGISGIISNSNNYNVNAAISMDNQNIMHYELILPFNNIKNSNYQVDSTSILGITLKVKGMPKMQMSGGGMPGGPGGGPPNGGPGGDMPAGPSPGMSGMDNMSELFTDNIIRLKYSYASHK